jgi:DNA ligase-1
MTEIDFSNHQFNGINVAADWIRDLESSNSRLHKERVIEKAFMAAQLGSSTAQCFLFNCYAAYNPFWVYHVRQIPETVGLTGQANPWPRFWALCEALRTRSVTGHAARDRIQALSQLFDSEQWNSVCRRVLTKDLRCGITEKTLNQVLGNSAWRIPVFACQLARDSTEQTRQMQGLKRLEVKLDGVRVLAVVTGNTCVLHSRNGRVMENFPQVAEAIMDNRQLLSAGLDAVNFVLDGEIVGESFQQLMRQAHRKQHAHTQDMVYHVFDIMPLTDFTNGCCKVSQQHRLDWLSAAQTALTQHHCLRVMPGMTVDLDQAQGHDIMRRFGEAAVSQGYEGLMIKDLSAHYECKRTSAWLKWKPFIEVSLEVIDVEPGTGKNLGRLGALVCSGQDHGKHITVNVGSGFSDSDRTEYWNSRSDLVGQIVEVRADAITQNQDGSYSLRFPRFVRFRGFEPGEKL